MARRFLMAVMVTAGVCGAPLPGAAQVIGSFQWQTQPYCNLVTLTVVQTGGVYQLMGHDNLCGAGVAPVTGTAMPTAGGVAIGLAMSRPSGRAEHLTASIDLSTLSGTWADADGRSGNFTFGSATGGSPRPEPAASAAIVVSQFSPAVYGGTGSAATVARSDHLHDDRYYTKTQVDTRVPQADSVTLAAGAFVARDGPSVFLVGTACFRNSTPNFGLRHTIPLTSGSVVTGITARITSTQAAQPYTITLWAQRPGSVEGATVVTSSQFAPEGLTSTDILLPIPEIVNAGEALYVAFSSSSTSVYLCAAQVHFNRP